MDINMKTCIKLISLTYITFLFIIGIFGGLADHAANVQTGCHYTALIDYNPPRAIICELMRNRWCDEHGGLACEDISKKTVDKEPEKQKGKGES